jgi:hypothetical protein
MKISEIKWGVSEDIQEKYLLHSDNTLDYYTDKKNVPNTILVKMTTKHISTVRRDMFDTLEFLNLLDAQNRFINTTFKQKENTHIPDTISHLQSLPLSDEQKHVLYGFILLWGCGGYPDALLDKDSRGVYKKIQTLFLDYPADTPEKLYCTKENFLKEKQIEENTPPECFDDVFPLIKWFREKLGYRFCGGDMGIEHRIERWIENKGCYADTSTDEYKSYLKSARKN